MKTAKILTMTVLMLAGILKADGFIVIPRPPHPGHPSTPYPLEVRYHRVEVHIENSFAKTSISQEFYNPTGSRLEGMYIFPVPEGAVINNFSMALNGKKITAELLDAEKAKKIYEEIVLRMKDPALLEYAGRNAFKVRIYPIEPHSTKKVGIEYGQILRSDSNTFNYVYPLNTEKFSSKPIKEVSIKINLETKEKIKMLFCPSHNVEIKRNGDNRAVIGFEESNVLPDTDFSLYYSTAGSNVGVDLLTHKIIDSRIKQEDGFFILNISPSNKISEKEILQKNIVFVIDTSGSMAGRKIEQAKNALIFCVDNLNRNDRFEIISFSTEAENLFGSLKTANKQNIEKAKTFIGNMRPVGGTNIEEALSTAFSALREKGGDNASIVFITDGKPTIGMTGENELAELVRKENTDNARVFVFGIDYGINTHLLDRIAEISAGYRTYITPEEDLELKLSSFYEKIRFPVFSDIRIDFGKIKVQKVYPKKLPDLFKNSQIVIMGRYKRGGRTQISLEGWMAGSKKTLKYEFDFPHENSENRFIPQLWAAQHVGYLMDEIRLNGENKELKDEIIKTARRYGIVTPYTSFLIIEEEERLSRSGEINPSLMPLKTEVGTDKSFRDEIGLEYRHIDSKEGEGSVRVSREISALQNTVNQQQIYQGRQRLNYKDTSGRLQNLASQVKNIQGRAVYQSNNTWIDSEIQEVKNTEIKKMQFGSEEYFDLLREEPASAEFLALGKNVQFILKNTLYEIYE
jgi:Ca-activated chloride channel homolog